MKIELHPTSKIVQLQTPTGTVPARIWEGTTDRGTPVHAFITRICPSIPEPLSDSIATEFRESLQETRTPSAAVQTIPLRMIL